jgi:prevent-host-death family protein
MAAKKPPATETKSVSEARRTFSETLNRVYRGETRVLVEKNGIVVGAVVSARDLERLHELDEKAERAVQAFEDMQAAFADVPEEEFDRELAKALEDVKAERRRRSDAAPKKSA